jgi:hypothetical protein
MSVVLKYFIAFLKQLPDDLTIPLEADVSNSLVNKEVAD